MKWTVLNSESAWREGNGDYLPRETDGEMKGVAGKGRKREKGRGEDVRNGAFRPLNPLFGRRFQVWFQPRPLFTLPPLKIVLSCLE